MVNKNSTSVLFVVVFFLCSFGPLPAHGAEVSIIAAADLQYALKDVVAAYAKKYPADKATLVFGSSGKAYSQIASGAPHDIFFSADISYPLKLKTAGLTVSAPKPYATGRIGIWATKKSGLDVKQGPAALLDSRVKTIAIANPEHAPYGRAAKAALEHYKLYDRLKDKIVMGEDIQQTAQFVQSGAADAAIIAASLALAPVLAEAGNFYLLPASSHPEILQGYVRLKRATANSAGRRFEAFIGGGEARAIFKHYGFALPHE